jgi:hypothetical protein
MVSRGLCVVLLALTICGNTQSQSIPRDSYDVLLHSQSLDEQRTALTVILRDPKPYLPRIQRSLRDYPRLLRSDWTAENRAVYVAALVQDPSFPPILVGILRNKEVLAECKYGCSVELALTIHACFAGWTLPSNLDSRLTSVYDLRETVRRVPGITLQIRPIDEVVQGPGLEQHRKEIEGKTEEQLIQLAGPSTPSYETRVFAAYRLETSISTSKNRIDLYLLAMNDIRNDASGEYRNAIYESIYRAELARAGATSR